MDTAPKKSGMRSRWWARLPIAMAFASIVLLSLSLSNFSSSSAHSSAGNATASKAVVSSEAERLEERLPDSPRERERVVDERGFIVSERPHDPRILPTPPGLWCELARASNGRLVTDERGYLCSTAELSTESRCCQSRYRFSCVTCHNQTGCCATYPACVSCCMGGGAALSPASARARKTFEECVSLCRTSSRTLLDDSPWLRLVPHCWEHTVQTPQPSPAEESMVTLCSSESRTPAPDRHCYARWLLCRHCCGLSIGSRRCATHCNPDPRDREADDDKEHRYCWSHDQGRGAAPLPPSFDATNSTIEWL